MTSLTRIAQCAILGLTGAALIGQASFAAPPEEAALEHAKAYYEMAGKAYARGILNPAEGAPDYKTTLDGCAKILEELADYHDAPAEKWRASAFWLKGLAHYERGEFQAAFESLESYLASNADKKEKERKVAVDRLEELKLFGYLKLTVVPSDARVRIGDTESKPESRGWIKLNALPNEHVLQIDAPGFETYKKTIGVALRQLRDLTVVLKAGTGEPPESSWHPTAAWISAGVGGAGLVAGIICLVVADGKDQSIAELKDENGLIAGIPQQAAARQLASDRDSFRTAGALGLVTAGLGAVAATVFLLLPDESRPRNVLDESGTKEWPLVQFVPLGGGGLLQVQTSF